MLEDKEQAATLINEAVKTNINPEDLEKSNNNFINNFLEKREADVVYKLKNKRIIFLIEHQSYVDKKMIIRIPEYQSQIMKSEGIKKVSENKYKTTKIIAIVVYTGNKKWTAPNNLKLTEENFKEANGLITEYKLIDVHNYKKEELENRKEFFFKFLLIEKAKNKEELERILDKIIKNLIPKYFSIMKKIINLVYANILGKDVALRLLENLEERGGSGMLNVVRMLNREKAKEERQRKIQRELGIREGEKIGLSKGEKIGLSKGEKQKASQIIKNLLFRNYPIDEIKEITGSDIEEINKIKASL